MTEDEAQEKRLYTIRGLVRKTAIDSFYFRTIGEVKVGHMIVKIEYKKGYYVATKGTTFLGSWSSILSAIDNVSLHLADAWKAPSCELGMIAWS